MDKYRHHVSGFFAYRQEAESTFLKLIERGLPYARLQIFEADSAESDVAPSDAETQTQSNAVLKDVLVDGAIGTAVGAGIGALTELALVAASVTLFVASPLVAPLAMLGWGASLGGFIGAATGAVMSHEDAPEKKQGTFSALVSDAISSGQVVLVADTRTEQETSIAQEVIQAAVGDYEGSSTA